MFDIGEAVKKMQKGHAVCRCGWNGKGMYIGLQYPAHGNPMTVPFVFMKTVQGDRIPWLCSQSDLLATDWMIVE